MLSTCPFTRLAPSLVLEKKRRKVAWEMKEAVVRPRIGRFQLFEFHALRIGNRPAPRNMHKIHISFQSESAILA